MNDLNAYYRALINYRLITGGNHQCTLFRNMLSEADLDKDSLTVTRNICTVDEDWITAIEEGLVFVEKAIKEERQFIYSNGEVLPIEKVKHVSKDSVNHLAKHSNLITRIPEEGDDIIPDKLYSVERLNDYAVYENRFLYMLLCYLRDFVTIRYNKILDLSNKYDGNLKLDKTITLPQRKFTYRVELHDERSNDPYLKANNPLNSIIDRIDILLKTIVAFLNTPLMECAAKAAMLKPPITKTNVLKMDNNFKGAVALYDYIIAYDKPGYTVKTETKELAPFSAVLADEISETVALLSFLVYEYGLDINSNLKGQYEAEEEKQRAKEIELRKEQLIALKKKLLNMECAPEEYIFQLEKQIKAMENEVGQVASLRDAVNDLTETKKELAAELENARNEIGDLTAEIDNIEIKHKEDISILKSEYNDRIHEIILSHETELKALEKQCNERISDIKCQMQEVIEKLNQDIRDARSSLNENITKLNELTEEYEKLLDEKRFCEARITALRALSGENFSDDDFTDQESFNELEKEFEAFIQFYDGRWNIAKAKIRKKLLNFQSLKGRNGH